MPNSGKICIELSPLLPSLNSYPLRKLFVRDKILFLGYPIDFFNKQSFDQMCEDLLDFEKQDDVGDSQRCLVLDSDSRYSHDSPLKHVYSFKSKRLK